MIATTPALRRALSALQRSRLAVPAIERPIVPPVGLTFMLAEVTATATISANRWLYTIGERGVGAPATYLDTARTNAITGYGLNVREFRNTAATIRGQIPVAQLPGTFAILPLSGVFLWWPYRCDDGTFLWLTQEPNDIHGVCGD